MGLLLFAPKGRDGFKVDPNGPLRAEHELLNEYVQQVLDNERWASQIRRPASASPRSTPNPKPASCSRSSSGSCR
jgi:hypothetical protein